MATDGSNGAAAAPFVPLAFEAAMQKALEELDVTAPAKEMKKRCVKANYAYANPL
jgi:hypothetical protein